MKECFFCFEEMAPYEGLCSSCKNRQPLKAEVDKQYRKVIRRLAISKMGFKEPLQIIIFSALASLLLFAVLYFLEYQKTDSTVPGFWQAWGIFGLILSIYFIIKGYRNSLRETVSTKGYFIEKSLREKLKRL